MELCLRLPRTDPYPLGIFKLRLAPDMATFHEQTILLISPIAFAGAPNRSYISSPVLHRVVEHRFAPDGSYPSFTTPCPHARRHRATVFNQTSVIVTRHAAARWPLSRPQPLQPFRPPRTTCPPAAAASTATPAQHAAPWLRRREPGP